MSADVLPAIGVEKLEAITLGECADVLRPIGLEQPETARRTRQRMFYATARYFYLG
ncbi:phage integrase central domain-containing protein [Paraburkholderia susongensis]|uniref:phage integrase central domain-containing protein n=1 Tax=Paraburkholderia susongensis TaxID=1515439 RepID=UPI00142DC8D0|nr:hypothetical protein [Paraburkholderia susongensis]